MPLRRRSMLLICLAFNESLLVESLENDGSPTGCNRPKDASTQLVLIPCAQPHDKSRLFVWMQTFMRVEFSTGIGYKAARFVVLAELPENVLEEVRAQRLSPQTRAYDVALKTAEHVQLVDPGLRIILLSNTPGKVKNPDALGEPAYIAEDGCKAWVIRKPGADHSGAHKKSPI